VLAVSIAVHLWQLLPAFQALGMVSDVAANAKFTMCDADAL